MGSFDPQLRPVSAAEQWRHRQAMNIAAQAYAAAAAAAAAANTPRGYRASDLANAYRPTPMMTARWVAEAAGVNILALLEAAPSIVQRDGYVLSVSHNTRTGEIHSVTLLVPTRIPRVVRLEKTAPGGHNPPASTGETDGGQGTEAEASGRD